MWCRGKEGIGLLSVGDYSGALGQYIRYFLRNADPRRTGLSIVTGGKKKNLYGLASKSHVGMQFLLAFCGSLSFAYS